jgi:hypothetical protein
MVVAGNLMAASRGRLRSNLSVMDLINSESAGNRDLFELTADFTKNLL